MEIHSTAIVHPGALLAEEVKIGPYSVVGENVSLGRGTRVGAHVILEGWTQIGESCQIGHGAIIGASPQDLKYRGEQSFVEIGNHNIIREYVTIHRGTGEGGITRIGNNNYFMANVHVAHNCQIGNNVILTNLASLAGFVVVEDNAVIGGLVAIHQFARIGRLAMVGGFSRVPQDIPPFLLAAGAPVRIYGLNLVGLERYNFPEESKNKLKKAFKILYRSNLNVSQALKRIEEEIRGEEAVDHLVKFIKSSQRGICK